MKKLKSWQWVVFAVSLFLMFFNQVLPCFDGLSRMGMSILCITIGSLLLMVCVDMKWGPLLCVLAFPVNDVYSLSQAMSMSFGNTTVIFCLFNTMLLYVLKKTGVLQRIAIWLITRPITRKSPWAFISIFWAVTLYFGAFINVTACTVLFLTLSIEILSSMGYTKEDRTAQLFMLGTMFGCALSFGLTPIGHPSPLTAIGLFSEFVDVSIMKYSVVGLVMGIPALAVFVLLMKYVYKLDVSRFQDFDPESLIKDRTAMGKDEKISLAVFVGVVILWLLPDIVKNSLPTIYTFVNKMGILTPAILGCVILCLVRVNGKPIMDMMDSLRNGAEWGAVFIMLAAMTLTSAIGNTEAGLSTWMSEKLAPVFGSMAPFMFVFVMSVLCIVITNFTSCTVAVTVPAAIALPLIASGAVTGVNMGAFCVTIGVTQALAFMTPPAGTVAAVTTGFGWIPAKSMFKDGAIFSVIFGILLTCGVYYFGCLFF